MLDIDIEKKLHGQGGEMTLTVALQIGRGDFVALSGPSGSGKTTLLRILAGLEEAKGTIRAGSRVWQDKKFCLPVQKRRIGFVFQEYALFENMNVLKNLLFVKKDPTLANKLLEMTGLSRMKQRMPASLSGGQKQRVSLCRAMMNEPQLLLMDEPLSALDPEMRTKLQHDILKLHKAFGTTTVMVSHDPSEIYRLADWMVELDHGRITGRGKPKDLLLKTKGSHKFSFEGELLDIVTVDVISVAIVSIGQQIVEVVISQEQAQALEIGQAVSVGTKAFAPILQG
ncbi:MAG: ABC transporter ATP-binding protein [Campylobacterota bacterium]